MSVGSLYGCDKPCCLRDLWHFCPRILRGLTLEQETLECNWCRCCALLILIQLYIVQFVCTSPIFVGLDYQGSLCRPQKLRDGICGYMQLQSCFGDMLKSLQSFDQEDLIVQSGSRKVEAQEIQYLKLNSAWQSSLFVSPVGFVKVLRI